METMTIPPMFADDSMKHPSAVPGDMASENTQSGSKYSSFLAELIKCRFISILINIGSMPSVNSKELM